MALQDDVNILTAEVQAREPFLKGANVGFDGDPNTSVLPIITNAPLGTWYHRPTGDEFWRKNNAGTWELQGSGGGGGASDAFTATPITVTADPTSAAPRAPASTIFTSQADVDAYLASQSATAFRHLADFYDFLPSFIQHAITINMTAGLHRPTASALAGTAFAQDFSKKIYIGEGSLTINGEQNTSLWDEKHPGGTVTAFQEGSLDPYIDCDPATFPNDGSLKGYWAVTSDGFSGVIHDHTDSRLRLCSNVTPNPTPAVSTVSVRSPSTVFRNSLDDSTPFSSNGLIFDISNSTQRACTLSAVKIQDNGNSLTTIIYGGFFPWVDVMWDGRDGPYIGNGNTIAVRAPLPGTNFTFLTRCSHIAQFDGPGVDGLMDATGAGNGVNAFNCYLAEGEDGIFIDVGARFGIFATIIERIGRAAVFDQFANRAMIGAYNGSTIDLQEIAFFNPGVRSAFRSPGSGNWSAIQGASGSRLFDFDGDLALSFENIPGPCVVVEANCRMDIQGAPVGLIDGGGNGDVGVEILGPYATVTFDQNTNVAGANGDVRFADGGVADYQDITDAGALTDTGFNIVRRP